MSSTLRARGLLPTRVGVAVFVLGLAVTAGAAVLVAELDRGGQRDFVADAAEAEAAIDTRLAVYVEVVEGLRGLYRSDATVTRDEFHRFVGAAQLQARWPGIDGLAFARRVPIDTVGTYEAAVRSELRTWAPDSPGFTVWPRPQPEAVELVVGEFAEPMHGIEGVLGFDLNSEPVRAEALGVARDTGQTTATAPLQLASDPDGGAGLLLVAPVYDGDAASVTDRRAQLSGYVVAAFRVDGMLRDALAAVPLAVHVTDAEADHGQLLGTDQLDGRRMTFEVVFGGRTWIVDVGDGSRVLPFGISRAVFVGLIGVVMSVIIAAVVELRGRAHRRAGAASAAMEREVRLDPISGLLNRFGVSEAIGWQLGAVDDPAKVAAVLVDIDLFKRVNDERGRRAGDELLRAVGEVIQRSAGDDAVAARLVGDQFAVVITDRVASGERALALAHGVRRLIATIHEVGSTPIAVTATVGLAYGRGADPERLLADAGAALHEAKRAGGDRVEVFDQRLRQRLERQMKLETDLRVAIRERQFELRYQPQARARSGEIAGFEVLIRWEHPEFGLLGPQDFIPVAEQAGLIQHLDRFVLEESLRQQRAWRAELGRAMEMGVNLSGVTLVKDTIVDVVRQLLTRHDMNPADLCIEVTETAIIDTPDLAESRLASLRDLSVRIDLDDFGTGYSSLTHLQRLPLTGIKIDRSFVSGLETEPKDAAIVEAAIRLAQQLGLRVVAEGVEDVFQAGHLDALDCDLLQGYLVGRPMSAEQATELLVSGQAVPVEEYPTSPS